MAITERRRHELLTRAQEVLGADHAETLMELLPPVGWADVVTNRSLDDKLTVQSARLDARLADIEARVDVRLAELRADLHEELRRLQFTVLAASGVLVGVVTAVVGLLG